MQIHDLTIAINQRSTPVPGHPGVTFAPITTHEKNGRSNTSISTSLHTGTHVDSPNHFFENQMGIDEVSLYKLIGKGTVIDIRDEISGPVAITPKMLIAASRNKVLSNRIVILYSGWCQEHYYNVDYYDNHPYLTSEAAQWLVEQNIRTIGLDFPPDKPYDGEPVRGDGVIHETFLGNGIPHVENLISIAPLVNQEFVLIATPLKVEGGDGAPARVFAITDNDLPDW